MTETMGRREREEFARKLRHQRAELLQEVARAEGDLLLLSEESESEWSDSALEERLRHLLGSLDGYERQRLGETNAALGRIADGTYGLCERCGQPIAFERLKALPTARACAECKDEESEESVLTAEEEEEAPAPASVPADLALLSDEEIEELLWEQVREDGRVETEELEMACRRGVIHLGGALPSRAEHSILSQIVTDVMGFQEVVDRIEIEQLAWQREDRDKQEPLGQEMEDLGEAKESERELYGSEDIIESREEVLTEPAPLRQPAPEEE
jgi:DnaK suppressor protein